MDLRYQSGYEHLLSTLLYLEYTDAKPVPDELPFCKIVLNHIFKPHEFWKRLVSRPLGHCIGDFQTGNRNPETFGVIHPAKF